MRLFADSARLDCPGQVLDGGVGRRVREIVFALAVRTMLAHQPGFLTGHVLPARGADALWRAISDADRSWRSAARSRCSTDNSSPARRERGQSQAGRNPRSEEHTSELQSLMRISYAVFCLKKKKQHNKYTETNNTITITKNTQ